MSSFSLDKAEIKGIGLYTIIIINFKTIKYMKKLMFLLLLLIGYVSGSAQDEQFEKSLQDAKRGNAGAMRYMAFHYENGTKVTSDMEESLKWLKEAAFRKNTEAIGRIGYFYDWGNGGLQKDVKQAFAYYLVAATENDALTMNKLGKLYEEGRGCEKDLNEAIKLYYLSGFSMDEAKKCEKLAGIDSTSAPATYIEAFLRYAEGPEDDARAMFALYESYNYGLRGAEKDKPLATKWLKKAAEKGLTVAQHELGEYYFSLQDYKAAEKWYRLAAEKGNQESMSRLAVLCLHGIGDVEKDADLALALYIGSGEFDKIRKEFSGLSNVSDDVFLEKQVELFSSIAGALVTAPVTHPAELSTKPASQPGTEYKPPVNQPGTGYVQPSQTSLPKQVFCNHCNGSGYTCVLKTVPTYGTQTNVKQRCPYCSQLLDHGIVHVRQRCSRCQGKGYTIVY